MENNKLERFLKSNSGRHEIFHEGYRRAMAAGVNEFSFYLTNDKSEAGIYKESVLEGIKEREPSLAPAIDAMKEEV